MTNEEFEQFKKDYIEFAANKRLADYNKLQEELQRVYLLEEEKKIKEYRKKQIKQLSLQL